MTEKDQKSQAVNGSIVQVLNYYSIFQHPLTENEIFQRSSIKMNKDDLSNQLKSLVDREKIFCHKDYYGIVAGSSNLDRRKKGEKRAKKLLRIGHLMASLIYLFPFVRGVFISGSVSKGSVPEDADIDFFVVTKKNRLWVSRMCLVMFKRLFLFNSKKYFCTNYFVDEENLEIPDKNIFTATELATLIPMKGIQTCQNFLNQNHWYHDFFPNWKPNEIKKNEKGFMKSLSILFSETPFNGELGEKLDRAFMKKTYKRWVNLYGHQLDEESFELAFRCHRGTSKNHDKNYQGKVLQTIEEKVIQATIEPKLGNV